ncbi:helix-turn-helix transcriptional regulator [Uliginosibacterium sp. H3]|uniref:Helix-turn-helix transcriptional regulator n=1 Tax=Uliginosibacterium silvisoli TaxID=3114758 RepID=A0ABU6JY34_9RHOO|nr:helix-turn-helix transcriptional regulator [Uliginosibacterium sp. H3]
MSPVTALRSVPAVPDLSRESEVLARLARVVSEGPSSCVCVRSRSQHQLNAMDIDSGLLAIPLQGLKRVREGEGWSTFVPGEIILVPNARKIDMQNVPDERTGNYVAVAIALCAEAVTAARGLVPPQLHGKGEPGAIGRVTLADMAQELLDWCEAMARGDEVRARYVLVGILLKLHASGHTGVLAEPVATLAARIRIMIAANPAREWSSSDVETELATSGATLRRRLAEEGTSLRQVLADARLSYALNLLLTTRLPIKSVAARVGYASPSSFVKRFAERYGVEPSNVGGT